MRIDERVFCCVVQCGVHEGVDKRVRGIRVQSMPVGPLV